jgi:hypothetical protein
MLANVTRLDLRLRRRSTICYAAGMALYALVVVVLYPSFRHQTSLNGLSGSTAAALFGITGPLTSPGGSSQAKETARRLGLPSSVTARLTEGLRVPQERIDRVTLADTSWWHPADM